MKKFIYGCILGVVLSGLVFYFLNQMPYKAKTDNSLKEYMFIYDITSFRNEEIIDEYFKRISPEKTLDYILHYYSMKGTIYEDAWDTLSDSDKFIVLFDNYKSYYFNKDSVYYDTNTP